MGKLKKIQIDRFLATFHAFKNSPMPREGWVKYIRNALGMTTEQLAQRLGVSRRRVAKIEEAEVHDAVTLKTLRDAAEAMNCKLVYAILPKESINQIIKDQTRAFVEKHLKDVAHHMALESQSVIDKKAIEAQIEDLVQQYQSKPSKDIWNN